MPEAESEDRVPTYCFFCGRRAALAPDGGPNAFCIKCLDASAKRHPRLFEPPDDPYLNLCARQALGLL
jgi:hypothetical protein